MPGVPYCMGKANNIVCLRAPPLGPRNRRPRKVCGEYHVYPSVALFWGLLKEALTRRAELPLLLPLSMP